MTLPMSSAEWINAYTHECVRLEGGRVDLELNRRHALACYGASPLRDPLEAALNDQGRAFDALRSAWIDEFTMELGRLFEVSQPGRVAPQELAALGTSIWVTSWPIPAKEQAQAEFDSWPPIEGCKAGTGALEDAAHAARFAERNVPRPGKRLP